MKKLIIFLLIFLFTTIVICSGQTTNKISKVVFDVVMLIDNKVSPEVVKVYVQNVGLTLFITPQDIVYLTEHKVPADIISMLINKVGEAKIIVNNIAVNRDYREGYDYFYVNYLVPRMIYYNHRYYPRPIIPYRHHYR